MPNLTIKTEKTNLEKFYRGFPHFASMNLGENFIVFKTASSRVPDCVAEARKRIALLNLPLEVVSSHVIFNTFIVKETEATNA